MTVMTSDLKNLLVRAMASFNQFIWFERSKSVRYSNDDYVALVTFLSLKNAAAEDGSSILREVRDVPGSDALLQQVKKLGLVGVQSQFDALFVRQFKRAFGRKRRPRGVAIIDVHEQETYTKHKRTSPDVRGGKHKNGTNFFFHFATIQILAEGKVETLKVRLFRRGESLRDITVELVQCALQHAKVDLLLLDRGFRDVELLNDLEFGRIPILMPAFDDQRTRAALAKMRWHCRRWWFRNAKCEYADVTLLKATLPDGSAVGFYTTKHGAWWRPSRYFVDVYKKRWTIETGYRVQNQFLAKTTSVVGAIRLFYFSYAVALHNLWLELRGTILTIRFTVTRMKTMITTILFEIDVPVLS